MGQPRLELVMLLQEMVTLYEAIADHCLEDGDMDGALDFARRYHEKCDQLRSISPNLDPRKAYA